MDFANITSNLARQSLSCFNKDLLNLFGLTTIFTLLYLLDEKLFHIVTGTLSDAYLGVSVFVASTLAIYYSAEKWFKADFVAYFKDAGKMQVTISSCLGALPGCGGAIIVVTQYVKGNLTFGSLVAVLISTMGDASFLLLTQQPKMALLVFLVSISAGAITGYWIDKFHNLKLIPKKKVKKLKKKVEFSGISTALIKPFVWLFAPGLVLGISGAMQLDTNALFGPLASYQPTELIGFAGAFLCLFFWLNRPLPSWTGEQSEEQKSAPKLDSLVAETSFVSAWVIFGFLAFELVVYYFNLDLASAFKTVSWFVPLIAILVGFIPGCGPQILVTSLYLAGIVPLSAQIANAISNDGDALFPALALTPKAAFIATVYSAIPAFIIGYSLFFMGW